ncbi:MAG: hypothetical protein CMJ77_12090 [Planctomycetaceae bacterium]|nr:hypothetical protein [Planctomycetaceae bacterium]
MAIAIASLGLAFLISYLLTPAVRRAARRFNFVDRPDGGRKLQAKPVALGGGISLLIVTPIVFVLISMWWGSDLWMMTSQAAKEPGALFGLAAGAALLAVVGLLDDGIGVRGSYKLLWQVIAASLVMGTGLAIPKIVIFQTEIPLGALGSLLTITWLLGAINSFNLIDGVDGLAGSVGVVFSLTFGVIALLGGQQLDSIIAFALAGALLGFLRYNFPPATIYLGDTGSMFIGLILGTIALRCSMKQAATLAFAAPLAIWSIPMFDSLAAVVRRKLTGRSIYATDRGHIHHVLLTRGMSATQAVAFIVILCSVTCAGAVTSWYFQIEWLGFAVVLAVIGFLVFTRVFGHVEFVLLNTKLFGFGRFLSFGSSGDSVDDVHHTRVNLQGTRQWENLWGALVESAERFHLVKMQLNLSMPRLHENFYATWGKSGRHARDLLWQTEIPLIVEGQPVGRLSVTGQQHEAYASTEINQFIDFVETLESELTLLIRRESQMLAAVAEKDSKQQPSKDSPIVEGV